MSGDHLERLEAYLDARDAADETETIDAIADESRDGERPGMYRRKLTRTDLRAAVDELKQLRAEREALRPEWGVQGERSGRAQVCDDEEHARYLAERYSRFRLPGGDPVRHHVVHRLATGWQPAPHGGGCPCGCPVVEGMCSCPEPCPCEPDCGYCLVPNPLREPERGGETT